MSIQEFLKLHFKDKSFSITHLVIYINIFDISSLNNLVNFQMYFKSFLVVISSKTTPSFIYQMQN